MSLSNMKIISILSALAFALPTAFGHGHVMKWTIDGVDHAGFNPSNADELGATAERPTTNSDQGFADYNSAVVACGGTSAGTGLETWDVKDGSKVTAVWNTWPESHKGPVTEYMAACPDAGCDGVDAASLKWFKIEEALYNGAWPTDAIAAGGNDNGKTSFTIPSGLKSGNYLVRHDITAMHTTGAPQVYPVCFQAKLTGSGSAVPAATVSFPEVYASGDFLTWSLYNGADQTTFVNVGGAVYGSGSASPAPAPAPSSAAASASASATEAAPVPSSVAAVPSAVPTSVAEESTVAEMPVPTSAAEEYPTTSAAEEEYPTTSAAEEEYPTSSAAEAYPSAPASDAYPAPSASSAAPVVPTYAPEPVESSVAAPVAEPTSAAAPVPTGSTGTGGNLQSFTGAIGGAAPAVTVDGEKWVTSGNHFNFKGDALYRSCDNQRQACLDFANSQYGQTDTLRGVCEKQATDCHGFISYTKRDKIAASWARRGASVF